MSTLRHMLAVICAIMLISSSAQAGELGAGTSIHVTATPVPLNATAPDQDRIGDLVYRGGLELHSEHNWFGGYSGLTVSPDGRRLTAVSDRGTWLTAELNYQKGRLSGLQSAHVAPLLAPDGRQVGMRSRDAEAIARDPQGGLMVSFEGRHRLSYFPAAPSPVDTIPTQAAAPKDLRRAPSNKGLEALAILGPEQYLLITEDHRNGDMDAIGWILSHARDPERSTAAELSFAVSGLFHPTDAVALPDGDVLVLERRYVLLKGGSMRLRRIARKNIVPGARLVGTSLATIVPPLTVDNMEGVAVRQGPNGKTLIYVMSDDNFSTGLGTLWLPGQRTLLMMFELAE